MKDKFVVSAGVLLLMSFMALSVVTQRHTINLLKQQVQELVVQRDAAMRRIRSIDRQILPMDVVEKILEVYGEPLDDRER